MKVKYAMSDSPHAVSISATVEEAARVMSVFGISLVPVIFEGRPIGTVTEHALTTRVVARARDAHRTPVHEIMESRPTCVNENDDIEMARVILEHARDQRALVCRDDGTLSGLVTLLDLEKASYGEANGPLTHSPMPDHSHPDGWRSRFSTS